MCVVLIGILDSEVKSLMKQEMREGHEKIVAEVLKFSINVDEKWDEQHAKVSV